ncbi:hypothetical protein RAL09_002115 [Vibrio vulnificus]|nr:hypothetical protein [Vibrio vulnificus]
MYSKKTSLVVIALLIGSITTFVMLMLAGVIYPYGSAEFGNWAMWLGAIFGGIASTGALAAAYFTRKTIVFLTGQHKEQQELQKIQQYQSHKKVLYEVFDELLKNNTYRIQSKFKLYRSIFPENSISSTKLTASIEECSLAESVKTWNELIDYVKTTNNENFNVSIFEIDFIEKYIRLYEMLCLQRIDDRCFGDVYHRNVGFTEPKKVFNLVSAHTDLFDLYNFMSSLIEFSGLKGEITINSPSGPTPPIFLRYYLECPNSSYFIEKDSDALCAFEICATYLCHINVNSGFSNSLITTCLIYSSTLHQTIAFLKNERTQRDLITLIKAHCFEVVNFNPTQHYKSNAEKLIKKINEVEEATAKPNE